MSKILRHTTRHETFRVCGEARDKESINVQAFDIAKREFGKGAHSVTVVQGANDEAVSDDDRYVVGVYSDYSEGFEQPGRFGSES